MYRYLFYVCHVYYYQRCGSDIWKDPGFSSNMDPNPGFFPDKNPYIIKRKISQLDPAIFYEINFLRTISKY